MPHPVYQSGVDPQPAKNFTWTDRHSANLLYICNIHIGLLNTLSPDAFPEVNLAKKIVLAAEPRWRRLQRFPIPLAELRKGKRGEGRGKRGRERKEKEGGRRGEVNGRGPTSFSS